MFSSSNQQSELLTAVKAHTGIVVLGSFLAGSNYQI